VFSTFMATEPFSYGASFRTEGAIGWGFCGETTAGIGDDTALHTQGLCSRGWKGSRPGGAGELELGSRSQVSSMQFWCGGRRGREAGQWSEWPEAWHVVEEMSTGHGTSGLEATGASTLLWEDAGVCACVCVRA